MEEGRASRCHQQQVTSQEVAPAGVLSVFGHQESPWQRVLLKPRLLPEREDAAPRCGRPPHTCAWGRAVVSPHPASGLLTATTWLGSPVLPGPPPAWEPLSRQEKRDLYLPPQPPGAGHPESLQDPSRDPAAPL